MAVNGLIEPESFDVIVIGTGLPEAMLAAAAASTHHSVLHLDPHDFYGAHWASLNFAQFSSWTASGGCLPDSVSPSSSTHVISTDQRRVVDSSGLAAEGLESGGIGPVTNVDVDDSHESDVKSPESPSEEHTTVEGRSGSVEDLGELGLESIELEYGKPVFSGVKICEYDGVLLGASRSYNIDLSGPRVTLCGSNLINVLLRSGASHYVDFKGVEASYMWTGTRILAVPSSRADVFKDKLLSLPDKRYLMRFFKLVTDYAMSDDQSSVEVSAEDLDGPFLHFMRRQQLPTSIQSIILYAIALVDDDQQADGDSNPLLKTRDGLQKLALYLSSVARFPNAPGAFLYPLYGQGELPQAFCRSAAVNGALYVLRRPVKSLLVDKDSKEYKAVQTLQGQILYSKKLIIGPSVIPKSGHHCGLASLTRLSQPNESSYLASSTSLSLTASLGQRRSSHVARCVCITDCSISEGQSTLLVIFPPRSVHYRCSTVIRALQLSSAASVCPEGKYIVQLSTICSDTADGREALEAAVEALFSSSETRSAETAQIESQVDVSSKPKLLWSVFYVQTLHTTAEDLALPGVAICNMPDGDLDCESLLKSTEELFKRLFPDKDFFPGTGAGAEDADTE